MKSFYIFFVGILLNLGVESNAQDEIFFENPRPEMTTNNVPSTSAPPNLKCGESNPGGLIFRFMDGFADYGEFPWMVAVIKKSNSSSVEWIQKDYVAAGSIIHPSVILSAGRWAGTIKPEELKVRAGEWDKSTTDEVYEYQERDVKKIVVHPEYFRESLYNDVSLLFLDKPYDLASAPQIGTACVGQSLPEPGAKCFGMGWGLGSKPTMTNVLKKLPVTLMSREDCETKLRETRLGKIFRLHDSLTCGSSAGESCKGDEGASLVCPVKGQSTRFILYGVSAYRLDHEDAPCVYAKAPQFYEWIGQVMSTEGFNSASYTYQPE